MYLPLPFLKKVTHSLTPQLYPSVVTEKVQSFDITHRRESSWKELQLVCLSARGQLQKQHPPSAQEHFCRYTGSMVLPGEREKAEDKALERRLLSFIFSIPWAFSSLWPCTFKVKMANRNKSLDLYDLGLCIWPTKHLLFSDAVSSLINSKQKLQCRYAPECHCF